jgi:phosphoribosylamine--glycine ligase
MKKPQNNKPRKRNSQRKRNNKGGKKNLSVLVVGSGGREHALIWKLRQSRRVDKIYCAPGNGGIGLQAKCVNIEPSDTKGLMEFVQRNQIDLTVVGPEDPLASGIADEFQRRKLRIFGPEKKAAQIEASKVFAKQFMQKYHIPTAPFRVFDSAGEAMGFCKTLAYPAVIKADGLAAGKGVIVVDSVDEANKTIESIVLENKFGPAGEKVIVESFVPGQELSVMAFTDGKVVLPLLPSQDHKQIFEGDKGPNTGGMGACCPAPFVTDELLEQIRHLIFEPLLNGFRNENITYKGLIYAGLMITADGPKVLEFNCRFGDPETQVVLPMLKTDLVEIIQAVIDRRLSNIGTLSWRDGSAACVVLASQGYPGKYETGKPINGLRKSYGSGTVVFHAGTSRNGRTTVTAGGRVLNVVGMHNDLRSALGRAYDVAKRIQFSGVYYRKDIGFRVLQSKEK